jgi:predicted dithiol-disulfide oxidoreductase (DUF899 family)
MTVPQVVSESEWRAELDAVRAQEKRATRANGSERFGLSVFLRDGDRVLRTYLTASRGVEALGSVWTFLDLTPLGRQEESEDAPAGTPQGPAYYWWRRHDEYPPQGGDDE